MHCETFKIECQKINIFALSFNLQLKRCSSLWNCIGYKRISYDNISKIVQIYGIYNNFQWFKVTTILNDFIVPNFYEHLANNDLVLNIVYYPICKLVIQRKFPILLSQQWSLWLKRLFIIYIFCRLQCNNSANLQACESVSMCSF